jgi:ATP-dependent RNA helicase DeaD
MPLQTISRLGIARVTSRNAFNTACLQPVEGIVGHCQSRPMHVAFVASTGLGNSRFATRWSYVASRPRRCTVSTACRRRLQMSAVDGDELDGSAAADEVETADPNMTVSIIGEPAVSGESEDDEDEDEEEDDEDAWFAVSTDELDAAASERATALEGVAADDGILDLGEIDDVGRDMMSVAGYERVVNVDVDAGGALEEDEDNNELLSGVGFDVLLEDERLVRILKKDFGYSTTTHVQLSAMPRISDGSDVMIQSYTGTGKTLAFLLPIFEAIDEESTAVQAVVVAPTRELAMQITREAERLCVGGDIRVMPLIGGANPARQAERLKFKPPHIVIGTPGRLAELEGNRVLRLRKCRIVVVDEIDQCMQDSFVEHLEYVFTGCPRDRQIVFVSATGDNDAVRAYAQKWMRVPELLRVVGQRKVPSNLEHFCTIVPARMRIDVLRRLMTTKDAPKQAICFVDDPRRVDIVCERLFEMKLAAGALRGNAHKLERAEVLRLFRKGAVPLLVTTEVAARGLDVPEVTHVFNLDLPTDADHYVHRAGRTGRAGAKGIVVSIATAETAFVIAKFEKELGLEITRMEPRGGIYAPPLERKSAPRTERERGVTAAHPASEALPARKVSDAQKGVPSARAAAATAAAAAAREARLAARFGPRPRSVAKAQMGQAKPQSIARIEIDRRLESSSDSPVRSPSSTSAELRSERFRTGERDVERDGQFGDRLDRRASSPPPRREREDRFEDRRSGGGYRGSNSRDGGMPSREGRFENRRTGGGYQSRGEGGYQASRGNSSSDGGMPSREGRFENRRAGNGYQSRAVGGYQASRDGQSGFSSQSEGRYQSRGGGGYQSRLDRGYESQSDGRYESRGGYQPRGDGRGEAGYEESRRMSGGGRSSPYGERRGGGSRDGKPSGAELRLKNKESRQIRESFKKRAPSGDFQAGLSRAPPPAARSRGKPTSDAGPVVDFSDDDDGDDEGWFVAGQENTKKKKKANRVQRSPKDRAREDFWVGNRANAPKPDAPKKS